MILSESTPRSDDEVERFAGAAIRRTKRLARNFAIAFVAPVFVACVIFLFARAGGKGEDTGALAGGMVAGVVFMGLLPGLVVRRMVGADARRLERVVRHGAVFRGELTRRSGTNAQTTFQVRWREHGEDATAVVNVPGTATVDDGDVTVLSCAEVKWVGVVLGGAGLHVGRRQR